MGPVIVTIHQPEHMPWLGFFNKVDQADVCVLLNSVQYRKNYFQNRNRIMGSTGPIWLTVPVITKGHMSSTIHNMRINNRVDWARKYWGMLENSYRKHPHFETYAPFFKGVCERDWTLLAQLNEEIIRFFAEQLGVATKFLRASDLPVTGSRNELLVAICEYVAADIYLAGQSAPDYLDQSLFQEAGIAIRQHGFRHPHYPQQGADEFQSHLSTADLLFNCGAESLEVIRAGSP